MKEEQTYNLYNDTVKLIFKDGGNRWSVSFKMPDGGWTDPRPTCGHSSIKAIKNKPFLLPWGVKLTAEAFSDEVWQLVKDGKAITRGVLDEVVLTSKKKYLETRDTAAERGSDVHGAIEMFLLGKEIPTLEGDALRRFKMFQEWWTAKAYEIVSVELPVYSKTLDYATKIDTIYQTAKGERIISDIKTGKDIYTETYAQLGAGALAYTEESGVSFSDASAILITETEVRETRISEKNLDVKDAIHFWEAYAQLYKQSMLWENKFN